MEIGTPTLDYLNIAKRALPAVVLATLWCWESWHPFFSQRTGRWKHAGQNLAISEFNTVVVALAFGSLTASVAY
jgi:hypothetical protein